MLKILSINVSRLTDILWTLRFQPINWRNFRKVISVITHGCWHLPDVYIALLGNSYFLKTLERIENWSRAAAAARSIYSLHFASSCTCLLHKYNKLKSLKVAKSKDDDGSSARVVVDGLCDCVCDSVGDDAGDGVRDDVCDGVCFGDGSGKVKDRQWWLRLLLMMVVSMVLRMVLRGGGENTGKDVC